MWPRQAAQQARVRIRIGSNTTIIGLGKKATIKGAWLDIRGTANVANSRSSVIVRNLTFLGPYDCFPQWAPTDGSLGSWNAQYDSISLRDTNNVWIDHNRFEDRATADNLQPRHFGVLYQVHDGLVDITNASDLVTVSWNRFGNHDEVDADRLVGQRECRSRQAARDAASQRVRARRPARAARDASVKFISTTTSTTCAARRPINYSWGVGIESAIYAEENFFLGERTLTPGSAHRALRTARRSRLPARCCSGRACAITVDVIGAWNAANDPDLGFDAGWVPALNHQLLPAWTTPLLVPLLAGPILD